MATVRFQIKGAPGGISLHAFLSAIENSFKILGDLDSAISGGPRGSLDWVVTYLGIGSLTVEIESRSRLKDQNFGSEVASRFVGGLAQIEQEGTTPPYFSEFGLRRARELFRLIGKDGAEGLLLSDLSRTFEFSTQASANLEPLIRPGRRSIGAVEGRLETISIHGRARFIVYHGLTRKAVTCKASLEEMLQLAQGAFGRRVNVAGIVHSNVKGEPLRVEPEKIRILRNEEELPATAELSGSDPNFTRGLTTEDFIRSIRGG